MRERRACKYKGKDMKTADMGMGTHEKEQLVAALAPMKPRIVEKP